MNATDWAEFLTFDLTEQIGRLTAADWLQERTGDEGLAELLRRFAFVPAVGARALWNARPGASEPKTGTSGAYWFEQPVTDGAVRLSVFRVAETRLAGSRPEPAGWHAYAYSRWYAHDTPGYQWHGAVEPTPAAAVVSLAAAARRSRWAIEHLIGLPVYEGCVRYGGEPRPEFWEQLSLAAELAAAE